jgi:hypothetical protein
VTGYLQRLASSALNPAKTIYPLLGSVYAAPRYLRRVESFPLEEDSISIQLLEPSPAAYPRAEPRFSARAEAADPVPKTLLPQESPFTPATKVHNEQHLASETEPVILSRDVNLPLEAAEFAPLFPSAATTTSAVADSSDETPVSPKAQPNYDNSAKPVERPATKDDKNRHADPAPSRPEDIPSSRVPSALAQGLNVDTAQSENAGGVFLKTLAARPVQATVVSPMVSFSIDEGRPPGRKQADQGQGREQLEEPYQPLLANSTLPTILPGSPPAGRRALALPTEQYRGNRGQPPQDEIQIHIGRIEVIAVPPAPLRPPARSAPTSVSLDDYLKRRDRRGT